MSEPYVLIHADLVSLERRISQGLAERESIAGECITEDERVEATTLAWSIYRAAAECGYSPLDLAAVTSVPLTALDLVGLRRRLTAVVPR